MQLPSAATAFIDVKPPVGFASTAFTVRVTAPTVAVSIEFSSEKFVKAFAAVSASELLI